MSTQVLTFGCYHGLSVEEIAIRDPAYLGILMYSDWFRVLDIYPSLINEGYDRYMPLIKIGNGMILPINKIRASYPSIYTQICEDKRLLANNSHIDNWITEHKYDELTNIKKDIPAREIGDILYTD